MLKTSEIRYLQIDTSKKIRWLAIYIQGQEGFQETVAAKLDMRWLRGNTDGETNLLMIGLPKAKSLRNFKTWR